MNTPVPAAAGPGTSEATEQRPLTPEELGQLTQRAAESIEQAKTDVRKVIEGVKSVASSIETYGNELISAMNGSATGLTTQVQNYATRAIEAGRIIEQAKGKATGK